MKNDVEMQKEVVDELDREPRVVAGTIGVEVHHGVVKLAGRVSDDATSKTAEFAAQRVDGVRSVIMDVDVASAMPAMGGRIAGEARRV
jgi:osmotically-inducible protein OsmY